MRSFLASLAAPALAGSGVSQRQPTSLTAVDSIAELRNLAARDGDIALVTGYYVPGDGGGMTVRWDAASQAPDDGGSAFEAKSTKARVGRWLALHDGVGDFRRFGIFGPDRPADAALAAMMADPTIARIEAHTDLNFCRRHVFSRSHVTLDFGGHLVTCEGMEPNTHDNPFGALLFFTGTPSQDQVVHTLSADMPELVDVFEVGTASRFAVGQWWSATVNALSGRDERELQRLVQVIEIVDSTHIRVGYKNGWPLAAGRTITWRRIEPVVGVRVRNMRFVGAGPYDGPRFSNDPDPRSLTGSHPVAFEYAVRCDAIKIHGTKTFWPLVMRRWCTGFTTEGCTLADPLNIGYGGAGYLTQQIYCLYGRVADCRASNSRHLNDFTASGYCTVVNCHADGDDWGGNPFTTHGQYEHDLTFIGNSGLMDIANSGAQWGTAATRILVRRHVTSWLVANTKITDLTLEDVTVIPRSTFDPQATLWVNADGLQMRGCTAKFLAITQRTDASRRPTLIEGCTFDFSSLQSDATMVWGATARPVTFTDCAFTGSSDLRLNGVGPIRFVRCRFDAPAGGAPLTAKQCDVSFHSCHLTNVAVRIEATKDQRCTLIGTQVTGTTTSAGLIHRAASAATVTWELREVTLAAPGATALAIPGGTNAISLIGCTIEGSADLSASVSGASGRLLLSRCTTSQGTLTLPPTGPSVAIDRLLTIP